MSEDNDKIQTDFIELENNTKLGYLEQLELQRKVFGLFLSPGYSALDRSKKKEDKKKALEFEEFLSSDKSIVELLNKMMELYDVEDLIKLRDKIKEKYNSNKVKKL